MFTEITTVAAAFKSQNLDAATQIDLSALPLKYSRGMMALFQLQVIVEAVNNDDPNVPVWKADYNDEDQTKWFPWYTGGDETGAGFSFDVTNYVWTFTCTTGGARLALKDRERAVHMNKYFQELYKELWLVLIS